ncbi:MAG: hypothetical protein BGN97_14460 [Microbacterium sp. 69-10]|uniref:hypothetical protein n=1 Tax=Microbacterium sp. 69-10 TaxID=1895783 RepID=UPI000964536A|nr:hypothetical protein [Microbacterium sp. 69-10]OJU40004.1 MAG: hypothetical protein BGN97_14460 [Microbacterium sp. 69-10]
MYILLALIAACALGIGLHFVLPKRDLRGVAVTPGIATAAAAAIYTVLQWAGVAETSAWLWFASLGGGLLLAAVLTVAISAVRTRRDAAAKQALGI